MINIKVCKWCGISFDANRNKDTAAVCMGCRAHRRWLLESIRYSDHAAKYALRVESKEASARENRAKTKANGLKRATEAAEALPEPDRLAKVEAMLAKLMNELGVTEGAKM